MKRLITVLFALVLSSAIMFAQEQTPVKTQTKQQTKEQVKVQAQDQSGDPIMVQERVRTNEGKGTMKRAENREMRKQNHGAVVSETAKGTPGGPGKGEAVSGVAKQKRDGVQQHDRDQVNKQAKPMNRTGARPPMHQGATPPRTGTMQRGGRK